MTQNEHSQYGNNFYHIFEELRSCENDSEFSQSALNQAERYGSNWQQFLHENKELLERTFKALETVAEYRSLLRKYHRLNKEKKWDEADTFEAESDLEQFGITAWNQLNVCLEEISCVLLNYGIDVKNFGSKGE